ncbi:hypothetical protein ES703_56308 [subsurface metagenome]
MASLNGNIFKEAKELRNTKLIDKMSYEEVLTVKAAMIPLNIMPQFEDMTIDQGLEYLSLLFEEANKGQPVIKSNPGGVSEP